jgi:hypothetical protein
MKAMLHFTRSEHLEDFLSKRGVLIEPKPDRFAVAVANAAWIMLGVYGVAFVVWMFGKWRGWW